MSSKRNLAAAVIAALAATSMTANADNATEEKTTVGGKAFIDLTNIQQESDGVDTAATGTGVDVKRFYLSVSHTFDDMWSANVTSDFNYVSNDAETQLYIKKAYLQMKISDGFVARIGSADLPWVPFVEDLYGYRYVENVLVDRLKSARSADWGVHAGGQVLRRAVQLCRIRNQRQRLQEPDADEKCRHRGPIRSVSGQGTYLCGRLLLRQARQGCRGRHTDWAHGDPVHGARCLRRSEIPRRRGIF